tara:strand:+ start:23 stop:244 length:222 start_codon:yes stop_codon:yes gene_type:complete
MNISKQKQNLINELSFNILKDIDQLNDNLILTPLYKKTNIKTLINIINSSYYYTNKEIKELIKEFYNKSLLLH